MDREVFKVIVETFEKTSCGWIDLRLNEFVKLQANQIFSLPRQYDFVTTRMF
jgi:hypothetical protein